MLARLFRPRWQHRDPAVRCRAVAEMSSADAEQAGILATLARGDSDAGVRAAVCARLTDIPLLDRMIQQDRDAIVVAAASDQVKALLAGQVEHGPGLENRLRLLGLTDNQSILAHVALHCADEPCRVMAIDRLDDADLLEQLVFESTMEDVQVAACARIDDEAVLRRIIKSVSAKRLQRQARDQLKQLQQRRDARRALEHTQAQLQENLHKLLTHPDDPLFEGRLVKARQEWQALQQAAPELADNVEPALSQCEALWQERLADARATESRDAALAEQAHAVTQLQALRDQLTSEDWSRWQQLRAAVDTQVARWLTATETVSPEESMRIRYEALLAHWQQALSLADQGAEGQTQDWPEDFPRPPWLTDDTGPEQVTPDTADTTQADKESRRLLAQLDQALRARQLKRANRCWQRLRDHLGEAADEDAWTARLERPGARLAELRDWHQFAAHPKKEALCREMEALAEAPLPAEEQAGAIQALHDAWKELMSADQEADQALWDRFKAASDKAWEPCREHFAALDEQRRDNLARRQQLCQQLEDFIKHIDWQQADWPAVFELRQTAPKEWQTLTPVRFTDAREVNRRFSQLLAQLDEHLDATNDTHRQAREALIEQATALASAADPVAAANECKVLQEKWKQTGWVKPHVHHKLFRRFRRQADRIFEARNAQQAESRKQRQAQEQTLQAQAKDLHALLAQSFEQLDPAALQQAVDELSLAVRESDLRQSSAPVDRALDAARSALKRLPQWRRWHRLVQQVKEAPEQDDDLKTQRQMAVGFEVAAGMESPPDAQQERTQWQIDRLSSAMTGGETRAPLAQCQALWQEAGLGTLTGDVRQRLLAALAAIEPR